MNPIDAMFQRLRANQQKAFIPFLAAGDPDLAFTREALGVLATAGASLIEVGVPFSDPIADGPVIQASYTRALNRGFKLADLFAATKTFDAVPLVTMGSYSLIHKRGVAKFLDEAKAAGISGAVVPDLPAEEAVELAKAAADLDFKLILLVTPTTSPQRAEAIVKACTGFVYVVSVVGITGARQTVATDLQAMITRLRTMTDKPLCVGFGVSTPEQAKNVASIADGVIVGSALVKMLDGAGTPDGRAKALQDLKTLATAIAQGVQSSK
ncbi:tryptophan synthase subunit alpha [soil metagenome]